MNKKNRTQMVVIAGMIAAAYAALTYAASAMGLAYMGIQFRFSEALSILPVFTPAAIPGLTIGCLIANLGSPLGLIDIVCGTVATLLSAICTYALRNVRLKGIPFLAPLPSVIFNALIVGAEIGFLSESAFLPVFFISALQIFIGQFVVCYGLGIALFLLIKNLKIFSLSK